MISSMKKGLFNYLFLIMSIGIVFNGYSSKANLKDEYSQRSECNALNADFKHYLDPSITRSYLNIDDRTYYCRNNNVIYKAIIGSKITCDKIPTKKSLGFFITLVKSLVVNPRPKPNIIIARHTGAIVFAISIIFF